MKKTIAALIIPLLVLSFQGLTSCRSNSEKKQLNPEQQEQEKNLENEIEKHVYPLPTSAEVIKMLTDLDVGFILGITNLPENAKKYFTSDRRSINLGAYGADLSYATLYNQQQEVINYMDAIRTLANELNMSQIYNAALYDSIKLHFDNRDRLVDILTSAFNNTYAYMTDNDQQNYALLVVGGAWVEGMYLTTHVSEAAYNVAGISKVLLDQKSSFELYLDITKPYMDDPIVANFVNSLDPIKTVYAGLTTSLTDKDIMDITEAISIIRSKVID
jgi:hypothetical protein